MTSYAAANRRSRIYGASNYDPRRATAAVLPWCRSWCELLANGVADGASWAVE